MVSIKKIELSIDLTRPAEEITEAIITVMEFFPGRQLEILEKVDQRIGEMLVALSPKEQTAEEDTKETP
ncbi:hypothetical protein GCM10010912_17480 [Paenibacillus albidus]|uniref:Uncharacterized protein n=1 Tax=Paenibacillus albidus TaxID=2041023 RepID=A0A917C680_9BACL|nr:hypothetical protein [Paenibacillus albidus]GGF72768.1 hypothetical protein GCM10010912_17480 [Paenibacillus albidus]